MWGFVNIGDYYFGIIEGNYADKWSTHKADRTTFTVQQLMSMNRRA
jgi:hypothetical protein